ncbi:MAG: hypothetical protein AAFO29_08835 [Actinomycetota bacterium]
MARLAPLDRSVIDRARALFSVPAPLGDVSYLVPGGFQRYAMVLHPPSLPDAAGDSKPARWSTLATAVGSSLDVSTSLSELATSYGEMVGRVEDAYVGSLTETVESGEWIVYRLRIGDLASSLHQEGQGLAVGISTLSGRTTPIETLPAVHLGSRPFHAGSLQNAGDLDASLEVFTGVIWPLDLSWWITSDIDLDYTIVGGSTDLIDRCLADDRFEVLPFD